MGELLKESERRHYNVYVERISTRQLKVSTTTMPTPTLLSTICLHDALITRLNECNNVYTLRKQINKNTAGVKDINIAVDYVKSKNTVSLDDVQTGKESID